MRWLFAALIGSSLLVPDPALAQEKTRVVVFKFEGPMGARVREQINTRIERTNHFELIDLGKVLDETGLRPSARAHEIATAKSLSKLVDIIVIGETRKRGRRWRLSVTYLSASDSSELGNDNWSAQRMGGLSVAGDEIAERLLAFEALAPASDESSGSSRDDWWEQGDDAESDRATPEDDSVEEVEWNWLSIAGYVGTMHRDLEANATVVNNGRSPTSPADATFQERRTYSSNGLGHMEVGILAEFYPGVFLDDPVPSIGIRTRLLYGLLLTTTGCEDRADLTMPCTAAEQFELNSSQYEFYLGARARHRFDELEDFTFFGDFGWGHLSFGFDKEDLQRLERISVVPSFSYNYLRLSVSGEYEAVPQLLTIGAELGGHLGLGIGREAKEIWGVESSGGSGWLLAVRAHSEVAEDVLLGLSFEYMTFSSDFEGQTTCIEGDCATSALDTTWEPWPTQGGDPNIISGGIADSVTDHYVRLAISVGTRL